MCSVNFDLHAGRALFQRLADELSENLYAIAKNADDETKLERATDLLEKTPRGVIALVSLAMVKTVLEYEAKIETYNSLLRKLMQGAGDV
jgi:hypothetical protein